MPDPGRLALGLTDYAATLEDRRTKVAEALKSLNESYRALKAVYEGSGATEFARGFESAVGACDEYLDRVPALVTWLEAKADALRRLDEAL